MGSETFTFKCPACNASLTIPMAYAGKQGQCNRCGTTITAREQNKVHLRAMVYAIVGMLAVAAILIYAAGKSIQKFSAESGSVVPTLVADEYVEQNQYIPPPPPPPPLELYYQYGANHEFAAITALKNEGFPPPTLIGFKDGMVFAEIQLSDGQVERLGLYVPLVGQKAVLAIRNAIYVMPSADPNWEYVVKLNGESPGPDLETVRGVSFLFKNGSLKWLNGADAVDVLQR